MPAPDFIKPLLGWREWRVADGRLFSPHLGTEWGTGILYARCEPYPEPGEIWDDAPAVIPNFMGETCRCGEVHEWLSTPTESGCRPRAYPMSRARSYSLAEPVEAEDAVAYAEWHHAPDERCSCGWYGLHRPPTPGGETVVGAIAGWGRIVVHPYGFRCATARVIGVVGDATVAARYGAHTAETVEELAGMITEAAPIPASVIPDDEPDGKRPRR